MSRGDHKIISADKYHRFWEKPPLIYGQDSGTCICILQNIKAFQYACSSAPIGDTDVPLCVAVVGR